MRQKRAKQLRSIYRQLPAEEFVKLTGGVVPKGARRRWAYRVFKRAYVRGKIDHLILG